MMNIFVFITFCYDPAGGRRSLRPRPGRKSSVHGLFPAPAAAAGRGARRPKIQTFCDSSITIIYIKKAVRRPTAQAGVPVVIHEMRPKVGTFAHRTGNFAEMVCSNSFRSDDDERNAVGLLHWEMGAAGGLIMEMMVEA